VLLNNDTLKKFESIFGSVYRKGNTIWKCMWVAIVWSIWIHRNNIIFRSKVKDVEEIFNLPQVKAWTWITNKVPH